MKAQTRSYASNTGDLAILANFSDKTNGIVTSVSGTETLAHSVGEAVNTGSGTATFARFAFPIINTQDHFAFEATLALGNGVTSANQASIWFDTGTGTLQLIARDGESPNNFTSLSDPLLNAHDVVAFGATYKVGAANTTGLFQSESGTLTRIVQTGDPAPGCPSGVKFSSFTLAVLPDTGWRRQ